MNKNHSFNKGESDSQKSDQYLKEIRKSTEEDIAFEEAEEVNNEDMEEVDIEVELKESFMTHSFSFLFEEKNSACNTNMDEKPFENHHSSNGIILLSK